MKIPFDVFQAPDDPSRIGPAWRDHLSSVFDISFGRDTDLSSAPRIITCELGPLLCGAVTAPSQQLGRSERMIAAQGVDHVLLQFYLAGSSVVDVGRRQSEIRVGQILVADMTQPILTQASAVSALNLVVPRSLLADRAGSVAGLHGTALTLDGNPARRLLFNYLSDLVTNLDSVETHQVAALSTAAVELLRACFEPDASPATARRQVEKMAVRRFIEEQIASHRLNVVSLAEHFSMSRAKLQRMFEQEGGISVYVRERRLLHARQLITAHQDGSGRRSVSQVAYDTGFANLSTFSRAFQRRFGVSPTEAARGESPDHADTATSDLLGSWMRGLIV